MKILIVDDDPVSRRVLRQILENEEGCEVAECTDGAEAWIQLQMLGHGFDAVFLDLTMPDVDGFDLFQRIHGMPSMRSLPVILCSSANDRATVIKAATLGAKHYIVKPPSPQVVKLKLQQALANPGSNAPFAAAS